ncbi:MAG: FAD-binding oxidoreductase, partial [Myxococcales bacterium]|nr:FAD-binding oxidoreductase [Myxococcales bacterium]
MTDHQHDDDRVSIPDVLAHAIVLPDAPESKPATADRGALPEGDSPVDTWAFPELASVPPPARDNSVVDEWAHGEEEDEATAAWRKSMPSLTDDVDAEEPSLATLRPSAVTLRPVAMQRRTSRGLLVAGLGIAAAAAVVGIATTRTPTAPTSAVAAPGLDVAVPELPQGITVRANPAGATFALAAAARAGGARIIRHNRVTDIRREPTGEWRVVTEQGDWLCEHVVNAGGTYARQVGLWSGLDLPITCMTHHYLVTDTVPEFLSLARELPVVRDDREVSGYIRMEQKSGLIGIYEKANPNTVWDDGTPWEAESELFAPDYDRIMPWLENAMERMPVLSQLGIKREV